MVTPRQQQAGQMLSGKTYAAIDVNNIMTDLPNLDLHELIEYLCTVSDVRRFAAFVGAIPQNEQKSRGWFSTLKDALHKKFRSEGIPYTARYVEVMRKSTREGAHILTSNVDAALSARMGIDLARMPAEHILIVSGDGDFSRVTDELRHEEHLCDIDISVAGVRGHIHQRLRDCITGELIELDAVFPHAKKNGNGNGNEHGYPSARGSRERDSDSHANKHGARHRQRRRKK